MSLPRFGSGTIFHLLFRQQNVLGVYEWELLDRVEETGGFQI
jgi:hypothetical protein